VHSGGNAAYRMIEQEIILSQIKEVIVALRCVIRATNLHSKYLAGTFGLTAPQILLLQAIRDKGQVTIGELADEISLSHPTVTTILDRLEKRELIYRKRSIKDRRKVHAYLTDKAVETQKNAPAPLQERFLERFSALQDWEQKMIISSLQQAAQMMDAKHYDDSPVVGIGPLGGRDQPPDDLMPIHKP
jgi:DNA-binding MarR family transcriptional regulator